jgi:exoribonuclease-2
MLPEKLSTDLTSLNQDADRLSIIIEMTIAEDGTILSSDIYRAMVRNKAKLAYRSVGAWLEGHGPIPAAVAAVDGLADNLRLQDAIAQKLMNFRQNHGALSFETKEGMPVFEGESVIDFKEEEKNRATELISNLMVAANGITARYLDAKNYPSLRRVVRTPERWNRIVELASENYYTLPDTPDSKALEDFLVKQKTADPIHFPDLSLSIIKLLGPGEYVADAPGGEAPGHFGLAVKDYEHSTAPNRRYPDIITHRLLKAALAQKPVPYSMNELAQLAAHCTQEEDAAKKVERQVNKSAAALLLQSRIGEHFDAIVTGAAAKGTWVRLLSMPVEGKLVRGFEGVDVGQRVRVELISVDIRKGFIDFKRAN